MGVVFASTEWHPEPQYLLKAIDIDKFEERLFAMADMSNMVNAHVVFTQDTIDKLLKLV